MKSKQLQEVERYNPKTGHFEMVSDVSDDEMIEILSIFSAEQRIMDRTIKINDWMYNMKGMPHIEYDWYEVII